jgi:EAL domain-containing protein (putative c-di-GMP-specific phosphodiesterase class I)/AmiR/NasT family two-component response regulator
MSDRAKIRVLALDDEPFMLNLLERTLGQLGYVQVTACGNAHDALREMDHPQGPPDLILLDLNMPEMDGVEFLRKLGWRRYSGALILVSGEDEQILHSVEKLVQTYGITALGHLNKPVQPKALAALIEKWKPAAEGNRRMPRTVFGADEVRAAIANGELVNYYQPAVAVASGELVGVEALVRWRHPTAGVVFPDQFIGIAETHGLIGDLTRAVLTAALVQAKAWRDAGLALRVAVNVSTEDLASLDFPDIVAGYAADAGVSPTSVVLEVTESRLMARLVIALDVLNRLRLKRFRLSIDDFGTGHSSLAQLRDIPFDELKVDRSFVHGAATNSKLRAIYSASLELGKQLHMKVVAEGVEDRTDWDFLRQTGCDLAQGYFISKPMPAADLDDWLADWKMRLVGEPLLVV